MAVCRARAAVVAVVALIATMVTAEPAASAEDYWQATAVTDWSFPDAAEPFDGIGGWVVVAATPAPDPGQVANTGYLYGVKFYSEGMSLSTVALSRTEQGAGVAGIHLQDRSGDAQPVIIPYAWSTGRPYFLMFHRVGEWTWGGWVYDQMADHWTLIGVVQPAGPPAPFRPHVATTVGGSYGESISAFASEGTGPATSCAAFTAVDAYFAPPVAIRSGSFSAGEPRWTTWPSGQCLTQASRVLGWMRYQLGGEPVFQDVPFVQWNLSALPSIDALATWVSIAPGPKPQAGQLPLTGVIVGQRFGDNVDGVIGLSWGPSGPVAGMRAPDGGPSLMVPYDWVPGRAYLLVVISTGSSWRGFVHDQTAATWTFLGELPAATSEGIQRFPLTGVFGAHGQPVEPFAFDELEAVSTCSAFPRLEAYVSPPIAFSGSDTLVATSGQEWPTFGSCPATITTELGWTHFRLGT